MLVSSTLLGVYRAERNCEKSLFQEWNACRGGSWVGKIVVLGRCPLGVSIIIVKIWTASSCVYLHNIHRYPWTKCVHTSSMFLQ